MNVVVTPPKAVLFDLSGTLHPQAQSMMLVQAELSLLLAEHPEIDPADLRGALQGAMATELTARLAQPFYLTTEMFAAGICNAFAALGATVTRAQWKAAHDEAWAPAAARMTPFPGVIPTLAALRRAGIATAIVTVNDEAELAPIVAALGLADQVDHILSSERARSCKPHAAIFEQALALVGAAAAEAVFVGDMPSMDILGANRVGMTSVLTVQEAGLMPHIEGLGPDAEPDHTIERIEDLLPLLGVLSAG